MGEDASQTLVTTLSCLDRDDLSGHPRKQDPGIQGLRSVFDGQGQKESDPQLPLSPIRQSGCDGMMV